MSDLEKDIQKDDELQIDIESDGFGDLEGFVDLDDLSDLSAESVFADMSELGDISDLGDLSDINELNVLEESNVLEEDDSDILGFELDSEDLLDGLISDSQNVADESGLESVEVSEAELDVSDLFSNIEAETLEEADEFVAEDIPVPMEMPFSDSIMNDLEEAAEIMENDIEVAVPETADSALETVFPEELAEPVFSEQIPEEESLDDMLDGLLDNLDANGSLEIENRESPEIVSEDIPEEEGGLDDLLSLLTAGGEETEEEEAQEDIIGLDEMLSEEVQESLIPETVEEEPEKPGLLKRLFGNVVTDEIAEKELADREAEKEAQALKEEEDAKAKEEAEAAKALKAEEKAAKKAEKAEEKALKKAAKAEEKAAKKAEKAARKAEAEAEAELEVVGKLNKVGVSIIVVLTALFLTAEISGTKIFSYRSTLNQAKDYFDMQRYTQAYQEILGTDIKEKDQETYDKIVTVMKVQRSLNSYANYESMKYYPDALNALLRGIEKYDENIETGRNLEVEKDMDSCREQILAILEEEYGLSESEAYDILAMEKEEYTEKVVEIGLNSK